MSLEPNERRGAVDERLLIAPEEILADARGAVIAGLVVARSWRDTGYRNRLAASPREVLAEEGLPIPDGVGVRVFFDTPSVRHVHLTSWTSEPAELAPLLADLLPLPEGAELRLIQNTADAVCLVVPRPPAAPELLTDPDVLRRLAPRASAFASGDVVVQSVSAEFEAEQAASAAASASASQSSSSSSATASETETAMAEASMFASESAFSQAQTSATAQSSATSQTSSVTQTNTYTTTDISTTSFEAVDVVTTQTLTAETTLAAAEEEAVATTTTAAAEAEAAAVVVAVAAGAIVLT